ncbi:hypothetical protein GJ496_007680 [Pomphorhynchus laevis]|nr:hypothetical protein GJ496_007680 [Pomphorhynchus laevis]
MLNFIFLSSREESTLNTVQLCAKNFEDEIGSSDSSDTLLPSTTHSQRDKSPVEDRCVDYSLLKKFDPLCVNNSQSLTESAFSETATLKFKRISTEYDYDEFAELIDKNRANFQMGEVDIKTDERQANLNVDEVTNVNEPDDNNDIDTDTNDEIFNIDAVKELIADMYAVIQDLLTTLEDNTNVRESEQVEMLSLRNERLQAELFDIETSYGQLHDRYEKLRTALEDAVNIAEEWKIRSDELTGFCEYERERYQKLKTACEDKLIDVINERNRIKSDHEKQMHTMEASLRKANLTIEDLSNTLDMKNDQILKLNKICDDLLRFKE